MRLRRLIWLIGGWVCTTLSLQAARIDSVLNLPAIGVPIINYSPENSWIFGAAVQGYFRTDSTLPTSIVQLHGAYTLAKQWYIKTSGTVYMGGVHPWQLAWNGGYRDYPDLWYERGNGAGNESGKIGVPYIGKRGHARVEGLWQVAQAWRIGPKVDFLYETNDLPSDNRVLQWGLGVVAQYDSRDVVYYPTHGILFKTEALYYEPYLGSTSRLGVWGVDLRQFIPIRWTPAYTMIVAWQFASRWVWSDHNERIPYPMLPTIGGADLIRGVRANMFRDNAMMALQAEVRIPIYSILHATVFAGVGDVYNTSDWQWAIPKVGYGLGLRGCINRAKVNIRVDVARNNLNNNWRDINSYSFYLTATEAF